MEKVHGTSAHISYDPYKEGCPVHFFSGGGKHEDFVALFDEELLKTNFWSKMGATPFTIYGEAYGGKLMGMRDTYGDKLRFIAFEVKIGDLWLSVEKAYEFCISLDIEFVPFEMVAAEVGVLDSMRDMDSLVAKRILGLDTSKPREGIVIRPPFEVRLNNGTRLIAKHKSAKFSEHKQPREVTPDKLEKAKEAAKIADDWVTHARLMHVLDAFPEPHAIQITGEVIKAMIADVQREGDQEIEFTPEVNKAISRAAALCYKNYLNSQIHNLTMEEEGDVDGAVFGHTRSTATKPEQCEYDTTGKCAETGYCSDTCMSTSEIAGQPF